jgi:hypothetical protein
VNTSRRTNGQAVLFAFLHSQQFLRPAPTIHLRGLEEGGVYRVKAIDGKLAVPGCGTESQPGGTAVTLSGSYLMNYGLNFRLEGVTTPLRWCWKGQTNNRVCLEERPSVFLRETIREPHEVVAASIEGLICSSRGVLVEVSYSRYGRKWKP